MISKDIWTSIGLKKDTKQRMRELKLVGSESDDDLINCLIIAYKEGERNLK